MATWTDVAAAAADLPETTQGMGYGTRAWRIRKKLLVWERPLRKTELKALGASAPIGDLIGLPTAHIEERGDLIACMPHVFFTTPHFARHAVVLARLEPLPVDVLQHLVRQAWLRSAPKRLVQQHRALHG